LQRGAEVALHEQLAGLGRPAAGQIDRGAAVPAAILLGVLLDVVGQERIHDEAVAREARRGGRDLAERHGAVARQRGDPGIGRRRHHGAAHACRHGAAVLAHEHLRIEFLGPPAQPVDGDDLLLGGRVEDDRRHARDVDDVGLDHAEHHAGRAARVDRVAAGLQDLESGMRRQIVTGRDHMARAGDRRAMDEHGGTSRWGWARLTPGGRLVTAAPQGDGEERA